MDKLTMAHDYFMKHAMTEISAEQLIEESWRYADAMQAEAEKRNKAEAEKKRKEIREMLNAPNTFVEREGQHFDDVSSDEIQAQRDAELYGTGFLKVTYDSNGVKYERLDPKNISICSANIGIDSKELKEWQPDWSQAPNGVTGWSMRADGRAAWHFHHGVGVLEAPSFGYTGSWKDSLRKRP